jgi:hypothetical protein
MGHIASEADNGNRDHGEKKFAHIMFFSEIYPTPVQRDASSP